MAPCDVASSICQAILEGPRVVAYVYELVDGEVKAGPYLA